MLNVKWWGPSRTIHRKMNNPATECFIHSLSLRNVFSFFFHMHFICWTCAQEERQQHDEYEQTSSHNYNWTDHLAVATYIYCSCLSSRVQIKLNSSIDGQWCWVLRWSAPSAQLHAEQIVILRQRKQQSTTNAMKPTKIRRRGEGNILFLLCLRSDETALCTKTATQKYVCVHDWISQETQRHHGCARCAKFKTTTTKTVDNKTDRKFKGENRQHAASLDQKIHCLPPTRANHAE